MTMELFTACRISSCKIPKLESEAIVRRRTNNAMVKLKGKAKVQWNLIRHTKGPWKCVGLYKMSEYSCFILVNKNTLQPSLFVGCQKMIEKKYAQSKH